MTVTLAKAELSDAEKLLEMQKICFAPHLERYQDFETSPALTTIEQMRHLVEFENYFKILLDGECVGAINIREREKTGEYLLHVINILPEYQNRGIGQRAIALAEAGFPDAKNWRLETLEDMPNNRHVYEKMGYSFTGEAVKVNDKLTLVYYEK